MTFAPLTLDVLKQEARIFASMLDRRKDHLLYGVTDGKAIGTYVEHGFRQYLAARYIFNQGSSAKGIDFPEFDVDIKVTNLRQPQSSSPFRSARQKIYGLGYSLLIFVYQKTDDHAERVGALEFVSTLFVASNRTADFQTTTGLRRIVENSGNLDDVLAFFQERFLPLDDIAAEDLAREILANPPQIGYLTISNALQWRLQYRRVIEQAGLIEGIQKLR